MELSSDQAEEGQFTAETRQLQDLDDFLEFLCEKYRVDKTKLFLEYTSRHPPSIKGGGAGFYDGLLSYRERNGRVEFLITVFKAAQDPLLTLGHEFAHLVDDLSSGNIGKSLGPPDDARESRFDELAERDLNEFLMEKKIDRSRGH